MNINDIRLENLKAVIRSCFDGKKVLLADALGRQPSSISRYFSKSTVNHRTIDDNTARRVEKLVGYPNGWMDLRHAYTPEEPMPDELMELISNYNLADSRGRKAILDKAKREAASATNELPIYKNRKAVGPSKITKKRL
jgi:plasmid maintenance system antidote protein VapI